MGKLVILQLPEGDFQRGFACTVQIGLDGDTIETRGQITGRLPANPDMPQQLNDEWRRVFNTDENSRIKAKQAGTTNFSKSNAVNNFVYYLNDWLNNSGDREWQKIRDGLQQHLNKEEEIRVIIQTQYPILRRLPWQAWDLFADNYPKAEIALSPTTFATPGDLPALNSNKVRILVVLGSSTVADGCQEIDITFDQEELEKLKQLGAELKFLEQPSPQELRECLWLEEGWDIFFFAGHSSSSDDGQDGEIILNELAQGLKITELFEALKKAISRGLQLAIFNSCDGLGLANQLAELNIRQMIVMREPVPDAVAKTFLKHFLTALACNNQSLYASVREARLRLEDFNEQYPGAKYLPVICQNSAVIPPTWEKLRTGGRIHGANWDVNPHLNRENVNSRRIGAGIWNFCFGQQAVATVGNPARPENQRILLAAVKEEVTARLRQSLHNTVLINLGKESQPQQVKRPWDAEIKIGLKPAEPLPDTTTILEVFDSEEIVGKLLILGAPGSGKTTTQLELAQELIKRAEEQPNYPVPVLFNLSSWKDDRLSLADWLLAELKSKYGVSKKLGKEWVNKRQLLPLLDGLDELEAQRQELCVLAINKFLAGDIRPFYLVVCSRIEEYSNYATQLQLNGAIYLQPLTNNQICAYLGSIEYIELWSTISSDIDLLELVKTPLLLSITVLASKEISVEEWQRLTSTANRLQYFSGYIPWNYARFLDYCTERLFLQRVGGRYRFIHKLLQDHFAQMEFKQD
ncbi:hypothetical protein DSM106972_095920 [Dulcicalothrix desertica PCC 7102]|uniref:CHAT domain-containing protein n=1 Tax=Dulcicalothrix desertica PCC 7102 TaxID=232991 RepID=A0A3S1C1J3_9CYAN|nr:CHAT domain-containing protein [Dulcicalothrix desertica]RUS93602.1 hypothetical protein DSM106972_095920 [Dulcicalothrix desertica PCC 7102]TWH54955.1 putative NTPase (NACHT family) [Dulcicalothrix desertica PCC 7102]